MIRSKNPNDPCVKCGNKRTRTASGKIYCHSCKSAMDKKYNENNKESLKNKGKLYYLKNRENFLRKGKEYTERNKTKLAESQRKWRESNKEIIRQKKKLYHERTKETRLQLRRSNPELIKERRKISYLRNKEKDRETARLYQINNRQKINARRKQYQIEHRHPLFVTWVGMNGRCHKPTHPDFRRWGGRGIFVYEPWRKVFGNSEYARQTNKIRFLNYVSYIETLRPKPSPLHTIDRIENEKGYEPGNLDWSSPKEQANNRRTNTTYRLSIPDDALIEYEGESMTILRFANVINLPIIVAKYRYAQWKEAWWIMRWDVDNRIWPYRGQRYTMRELELLSHRKYSTIRARLQDYSWTVERAVEE